MGCAYPKLIVNVLELIYVTDIVIHIVVLHTLAHPIALVKYVTQDLILFLNKKVDKIQINSTRGLFPR